jgi:hypothetical protein
MVWHTVKNGREYLWNTRIFSKLPLLIRENLPKAEVFPDKKRLSSNIPGFLAGDGDF